MVKQRTLNRVVKASGIGLHIGQKVMINFIPHTVDGGIVFRRIYLDPPVDIQANA
ncbi:UDP-3-O-acyl-N-acetylglucosamine deacetylase, partial [Acinetobacter baumannii]|uniref:UDP-3-O-acyl-N-acetylglucosamine deacetylase n=1 Tax=Acinetobacter baumannii TaxID=470 RepID=UPI003AF7B214